MKKDPFDYQSFKKRNIDNPDENEKLCKIFNENCIALSDLEFARYKEFCQNHLHKEVYKGASGGTISLRLTLTSIGTGKSCHCSVCDQVANITDYDIW